MVEWVEFERLRKEQVKRCNTEIWTENYRAQEKLASDMIMIDVDAQVHSQNRKTDYGIVTRKAYGKVRVMWALTEAKWSNKTAAEVDVIRYALIKAKMECWRKIIVQGSHQHVLQKVSSRNRKDVNAEVVLEDIILMQQFFHSCAFVYNKRKANDLSAEVAKFAIDIRQDIEWKGMFPVWIN